jgi:hypothetical protein
MIQIYFTKHSKDKILLLIGHGFKISEEFVILAINSPDKVFYRGNQRMFLKIFDEKHAIQVVCEEKEGIIKVITIFPVRRRRYGI